jgi:putative FmdB family regulatory protein
MPTYEFWCQQCTKSFELFISIAEYERQRKAGVHCPDCGGTKWEQRLSVFEVKTAKKS